MQKPFVFVVTAFWKTIMVEANTLKIARLVALAHIVVGVLLFIFGIVDRVEGYFWTGEGCFGIWCGIWMIITGSLGIPASSRERNSSSQALTGAFMGCAITSAVFGGIIIICFSISIAQYHYWSGYNFWGYYNYDAEMAVTAITLILGIVEFAIGIWAAVLCCFMNTCACCVTSSDQTTSVVYMSNQGVVSGGYIMGQGPGGVPMAFPMQAAGGVVTVPVSSSGAVGVHPQMVQVPGRMVHVAGQPQMYQMPPAGAIEMQPQMVQVPTSGGLGGQAQMIQVPTSGGLGGQAQMVQVPTSGSLGGQAQMVQVPISGVPGGQGQVFQVPTSGNVAGPPQMAHISGGAEGGQPQFVRVTPDGPEKGGQEAIS